MGGRFKFKKFSQIQLSDPFFDQLKADYPGTSSSTGFVEWFNKKSDANETALVFDDQQGLGAFVYLKTEREPIELKSGTLASTARMKIGTLRLATRYRGQRLGEGAIGLALWQWQKSGLDEIYVTVFDKHDTLIALFEKFGFEFAGYNLNGERVYLRSRQRLDYSTPYTSFPFINPSYEYAGYLIVDDQYHDTLFPYSELSNTLQEQISLSVANGFSKTYIGHPITIPPYKSGEPILVYRKFTGKGQAGFKSCVTSYCVVSEVITVKRDNQYYMTLDETLARIRNKSVFSESDIIQRYNDEKNFVIIEMVYYGYFGAGNNVNWIWLKNNNLWPNSYPTTARLTHNEFQTILEQGGVNVTNVLL
jgi:RimJ/RimL family protein N-acetyltransferase